MPSLFISKPNKYPVGMKGAVFFFWVFWCLSAQAKDSTQMTVKELIGQLNLIAEEAELSKIVRDDFHALALEHQIIETPEVFSEYVKVRLAFEATRDSGLWGIRWTVTDQEPRSDLIWKQWMTLKTAPPGQSAEAECDELSALFSFIAKRMGVARVGLFWPTSNHTVAVWSSKGKDGKLHRIIVPTSQVFLSPEASLGTKEFDTNIQKTIYNYDRRDVSLSQTIPRVLGQHFIDVLRQGVDLPQKELQKRRNQRSAKLGGS